MTDLHVDLRDALRAARARAVRFEHNAHLGQPVRSWQVYRYAIDLLASSTQHLDARDYTPDRDGLGKACNRLLALSEHLELDQAAVIRDARELVEWIDARITEAKASRP